MFVSLKQLRRKNLMLVFSMLSHNHVSKPLIMGHVFIFLIVGCYWSAQETGDSSFVFFFLSKTLQTKNHRCFPPLEPQFYHIISYDYKIFFSFIVHLCFSAAIDTVRFSKSENCIWFHISIIMVHVMTLVHSSSL